MDNPLQRPRPTEPIQQVHDYARDLAYLFVKGDANPRISIGGRFSWRDNPHIERESDSQDRIDFRHKWGNENEDPSMPGLPLPSFDLLSSYGYLDMLGTELENSYTVTNYVLTPKAFQLLEKPVKAPGIFISYSRKDSSAFALLIEARLRMVGADHVFIDKKIAAGDQWEEQLEETIREAQHFICLIGPNTLKSAVVKQEIQWAADAGCRIISIWYNGAKIGDDAPTNLKKLHAISVTGESAREYETAISELLNSLGYRTY